MRKPKDFLLLFLKGLGMGSADAVPGVSGGTVAFITGIYETLMDAIKSIDKEAVALLFSLKIKAFWEKINGTFLVVLFAGIATGLLTVGKLITHQLEANPISVWSFFFGLIIISAILVLREIKAWRWPVGMAILVGTAIAYGITVAGPAETPNALWFVFITGAVAICAMILPGISGAFILLIMGKYEYIFQALLKDKNLLVIAVFGAGCVTGLLTFSRAVSWVLKHFHDIAIGVLAGFMVGSLNKVWPWKVVTGYRINSHGEQVPAFDKSIWPNDYFEATAQNPQVLQAILFMASGFLFVLLIERAAYFTKASKN